MHTQTFPPTSHFIQEWEEAGSSLSSALEKYLITSQSLGNSVLLDDTHHAPLSTRIDSALQIRRSVLNRQLAQAHSSLAQVRNTLSSGAHSLPREILAEIFRSAIYSPLNKATPPGASMETTLLDIFRNLHTFQSVCHLWRCIIVSQGSLWYFAPVYCAEEPRSGCTRAPKLSLERCNRDLYLAAVMKFNPPNALYELRGASRFSKINLSTCSRTAISDLINNLLVNRSSLNLSELSLHEEKTPYQQGFARILSNTSSKWGAFCKLLENLSVLRIRRAHFSWNHISFSNCLVELRLQEVTLGHDSELAEFLNKLSSAPALRDLKFISIDSFFDARSFGVVRPENKFKFHSLESLYVEDLVENSLVTILSYIAPGPHRLTVYLTERYALGYEDEDPDIRFDSLCTEFKTVMVDTLVLCGEWGNEWLSASDLHILLCAMPELKTLKMSRWALYEDEWEALVPQLVEDPEDEGELEAFPNLECLDLSCVQILDEELLKVVVNMHSIERMVIGGSIGADLDDSESMEFYPLEEDEDIIEWLRLKVPDFTLTDDTTQPPEFCSSVWQLW